MRLPCSPLENCIRNSVKIANLSTTPRIIISVFPGFSHRSAYAPKHSKCPQGISKCLFSWAFLYPDVVLSHIRTEGQTAGQQAQTFLFFQICQKQQFNMSQKCIRSWKMYLQSLTIIDFPTLCANQMCAKKWVEESFIINLWKQRLVLAFFFAFFFFPVGMWFVGVGQYLSCVKERDYSLTGKSCLQSTSCLFWNIQRWDAFFALLQWMTHFMRKICIWKMIFFQIKVWPCPMPI